MRWEPLVGGVAIFSLSRSWKGDCPHLCFLATQTHLAVVVKKRYPKWNPGKWNPRLKPAVRWWLNFDPHPPDWGPDLETLKCFPPGSLTFKATARFKRKKWALEVRGLDVSLFVPDSTGRTQPTPKEAD